MNPVVIRHVDNSLVFRKRVSLLVGGEGGLCLEFGTLDFAMLDLWAKAENGSKEGKMRGAHENYPPNPTLKARAGDLLEKVQKNLLMANRAQIPTSNSALIAMIADEDTVVGFLLAGVGNVDLRRKTNYLIVDSKTTVKQIEDAFKEFTTREDIAVVLISQYVANMIRFLVDSYNKPVPAILEIPSKDHPYDPAHDSILSRVKYLFSTESVASGRR
ncbi:hypothetical protein V6N13_021878 [Hibiscus sabdariffa]|uniref:V-type proton ATPase subunit F n=1 Tax=Hibiscus sabdariffa TaxID=183260 RepID=A0ABR2CPY3_9ROSI